MDQIIDVEYEVVDGIENKSIEELAKETNQLYAQAEAVANVSLMYMAKAGARLEVIKQRLPHGEFENWCKNNLSFSKSKAEKMMKLNQKLSDKNSFLAKTESITDIGITKVWALLSAPDDIAEEVINNPESADMSTREFKEEIRKLKQEKEDLENKLQYEKNFSNELSENIVHLDKKLSGANARIAQLENEPLVDEETAKRNEELSSENKELSAEINRLKSLKLKVDKEREDLNNKLIREKEKARGLKDELEKEFESRTQSIIAGAREEALKEAHKAGTELQEALDASQRNIEKLEKQLQQSNNEALISFKLKCTELQLDFNSALASIDEVKEQDAEQADKMKAALGKVIEMMKGQI